MATRISPGLFINELDFSEVAPNLGTTRLMVVGGATKGALGEPIYATSEADLIR